MNLAAARVMARAERLAAISETPEGLTRVYLSPQHLEANQQVAHWMRQAGMIVWQDSVGNICGRYEGREEGAPAILLGSHLDTVRNAGRYDGMLGVLAAIEVVQSLHNQARAWRRPSKSSASAMKKEHALVSRYWAARV